MIQVALASVRGHFARFLLTALAVALGVAFTTGTFALSDALDETFSDLIGDTSAGIDVYVRGETKQNGFGFDPTQPATSMEFAEELKTVPGVQNAVPDIVGFATLIGADGLAVRRGGAPTLAFPVHADDPAVTILAGRLPVGEGEIMVEQTTLALSGLQVGQKASILVGAERLEVLISGSADTGTAAGATILLMDPEAATGFFAADRRTSAFVVRSDNSVPDAELVDRISAILPAGFEALTGAEYIAKRTAAVKEGLNFVTYFLLIFAVVALLVGAFLIVNTFLMLLGQRTQELAMLRAVGSRKSQIVGMVLTEAVVIGVVGAICGFALGIGLTIGIAALLNSTLSMDLPAVPPVTTQAVIAAAAVGVGVTLFAALGPAVRAARIPPVAAMRSQTDTGRQSMRWRWLLAGVTLAMGLALISPALSGTENANWYLTACASAFFVATVAAAAPLASRVVALVSWPVGYHSTVGNLARENSTRNPRRTALTAGALLIGLALVSSVGVLSASASASTKAVVRQGLSADFILNGGFQGVPKGLETTVARVPGVAHVVASTRVQVVVNDKPMRVTSSTVADLDRSIKYDLEAGSLAEFSDAKIAVSAATAKEQGWQLGQTLSLSVDQLQAESLTIVAIFADSTVTPQIMVHRPLIEQTVRDEFQRSDAVYVTAEPGTDLTQVHKALTAAVEPLVVVSVETKAEYAESLSGNLQRILNIVYALLGLSIAIAALGVANTLAMSIFERTRELGMLRAMGLKRGQLWFMVVWESVWTASLGAVLGVPLGTALGVIAQQWLIPEGLTDLAIPWLTIVGVFVGAGVLGVLAALVPAYRATKVQILAAIATP